MHRTRITRGLVELLLLGLCLFRGQQAWAQGPAPSKNAFEARAVTCLQNYVNEYQHQLETACQPDGEKRREVWNFYVSPPQEDRCYVYDPAHATLILWELHQGPEHQDLTRSRRHWNLRTDVKSDIGGSTYLLTPQVADQLVGACLRGKKYQVPVTWRGHGIRNLWSWEQGNKTKS